MADTEATREQCTRSVADRLPPTVRPPTLNVAVPSCPAGAKAAQPYHRVPLTPQQYTAFWALGCGANLDRLSQPCRPLTSFQMRVEAGGPQWVAYAVA